MTAGTRRRRPVVASTHGEVRTPDRIIPVAIRLQYDERDPFAVGLLVHHTPWCVSRELLAEGVVLGAVATAGRGDIRLGHDADLPGSLHIALSSPSGHAEIGGVPLVDLEAFLEATYRRVPPGTEDIASQLDQELALIRSPRR
jgi:hypothetical protein